MALKSLNTEVQSYIPKCQRDDKQPFTVNYTPMTKAMFDKYTDSLGEFKKGKYISHTGKSGEIILKLTLTPDKEGAILKNAIVDDKITDIKDLNEAVQFMLNIGSEIANEIEQVLRGSSSLDEDEIKN
jgi:hypothetical protein